MDNQAFAESVRQTIMNAQQAAGTRDLHVFITKAGFMRLSALKENELANTRDADPISLLGRSYTIDENLPDPLIVVARKDLIRF